MKKFNSAMQFVFGAFSFIGFISLIVSGSEIPNIGYKYAIISAVLTIICGLLFILFSRAEKILACFFAKKLIRKAKKYEKLSMKCNVAFIAYRYVIEHGEDAYKDAVNDYVGFYNGTK